MEGEEQRKKPTTERRHNRETATYTSTYAFNDYLRGEYSEPISLIEETVVQMQREGIDIEFLGATQRINGTGQLIECTARYAASSKGTVGQLNWRACLPASGPPQRDDTAESEARQISVEIG